MACLWQGATREASLPPPLHVPLECSTLPERKGVKRQSESALVDSPLPIEWKHIPDDAQHDLMRNQCRVLMALSLAAQSSPLPGVAELSVTATSKGTRVQAARPFPAGTLMLLPMVPGHLQVVKNSVHPHRVAVRAGGSVLYLVPCSKITSWPSPFWAVRRTFHVSESNSALADVRDDVVHSFWPTTGTLGPDTRHVCTETINVPVLVNTCALDAGDELVLLVSEVPENVGVGTSSKRLRKAPGR